jgi:hypothetical protein
MTDYAALTPAPQGQDELGRAIADANVPLPLVAGTAIEIQEMAGVQTIYAARFVVTITGKATDWIIADTLAEARARAWLDGQE